MTYELIDHTGDVGIAVRAPTLEGIYAEAARALFEILADPAGEPAVEWADFPVPPESPADGLRDFLAELLYRFSAERKMYVSFAPGSGKVAVGGAPYNPARHPLRTEIKAVTWHGLRVTREPDGWQARVIFDV
jgi:SHS2 domain-containing protein